MDAPKFLFSFLLSSLILCSTGVLTSPINNSARLAWIRNLVATQRDSLNFPTTTTTPAIVTVPSATPATVTPTPALTPVTLPPPTTTTSPTNPVITPIPTNPPATTTPAMAPPSTTTAPGQSWCVTKSGASEKSIQAALDYACGIGGADCASIQQGATCYNPNTLQNHASYAFNSYYQRNPVPTSCDFGGAAALTTANPSSGLCVFATSATAASPVTVTPPTTASPVSITPPTTASPVSITPPTTASPVSITPPTTASPVSMTPPTTASPVNPTPTPTPSTSSSTGASPIPMGFGTPPITLNASNPDLGFGLGGATTGGFGEGSPAPVANMNSSVSASSCVEPLVACIVAVVACIVILDMQRI